MENIAFPPPIERYFTATRGDDSEATLDCFADDASVCDNGEDLELHGIEAIRDWITDRVGGYNLTSEVKSGETRGDEFVAGVVVSGGFPGSPYEFAYRFRLRGDKIAELAIDPVGSLAS